MAQSFEQFIGARTSGNAQISQPNPNNAQTSQTAKGGVLSFEDFIENVKANGGTFQPSPLVASIPTIEQDKTPTISTTPSAPTMPSIVFGTAPLPTPKTQEELKQEKQAQQYAKYDDAVKQRNALKSESYDIDDELVAITQRSAMSSNYDGFASKEDADRYKELSQRQDEISKLLDDLKAPSVTAAKAEQTLGAYQNAGGTAYNFAQLGNSEIDNLLNASAYAGYATDDFTREQMAENMGNAPQDKEVKREADKLMRQGQERINDANLKIQANKDNTSKVGSFLIDAYSTALDLGTDAVVNLATGGVGGLANMGVRVFGLTAAESAEQGDSLQTQVAKGVTAAAIEVLTEKLGGAFEGIYGKTLATKVSGSELGKAISEAVNKLMPSPVGRRIIQFLAQSGSEGFEEVLSDVLNTAADHLFGWAQEDKTFWEDIKDDKQQILYDALLGSFMGMFGSVNVLANGNSNANTNANVDNIGNVAEAAQNAPQATQAETQQQTQPTQGNANTAQADELNNPTNERTAQIMQTLTQSGMGAAVAQEQAGYLSRLASGEKLSGSDIRNVLTQNPAVQQAFTEATGIEVPKGATASELRKVFNSVGEQTTTASAETTKPQTEIDNILSQPAQTEQTNTAQNDTTPIYQNDSSQGVQTEEAMPAVVGEKSLTVQPEIDNILNQQQGTQLNSFTADQAQPGMKRSQTESNTEQSVASKLGGEQEELYYMPITEKQTLMEAVNRVTTDMVGEVEKLTSKEMWTAADIDTAMTIYGKLMSDGIKNGDPAAANTWSKVVQSHGTSSGQALQAFSKWSRTGAAQAVNCSQQIEESSLSPEDKEKISADIFKFGKDFDNVADGDTDSIKDIIRRLNQYRGTGTFADAIRSKGGESVDTNFAKMLDKETDFDYLKEFAWRQMQAVTDDAITRPSLAQKLKAWQVLSQLSRLTTFGRNLGGNMAFGFQDMLANNSFALAIDGIVSKFTGKKTVGMEKGWLSSAVRENAAKELNRSILEVAADINMRSSGNRYDQSTSRTFKMNGGIGQRFMSRWQQGLSYSLSSSDAYFRGGIEQSVKDSLKNSGLSESEINEIAETTADYRLFQNDGKTAQKAKELRNWLNGIASITVDENGNSFGLGDALLPYPGVPANVGIKALEYSPANIVKGGKELVQVLKDAKAGKLDVTKQNQAVTDISRGFSGLPLIALLTAAFKGGFVKNWDDEEDLDAKAQNSAEGKSGVQINLDALMRSFNHESTEWQDGDDLMSVSWLEPLNAFMAIASLIASDEGEGLGVYAGDYIEGTIQSVLDLPMMGTIKDIFDTWQYSTADTSLGKLGDVAINFAGNAATGMIPAPFGQTAKTIDPYFRDTNADSEIGRIMNTAMSNIPILRETLPVKNDSYGNPKQYASSVGQRFLNNFILPGTVNELHQTAESSEVERIYKETGDAAVYPDRKAPNSIEVDGEKVRLNTEEKRTYQETYGQAYQASIAKLMDGKKWEDIPAEQQAEILSEAKSMATYEAKSKFFESKGSKYSNNQLDYIMGMRNPEQYVQTRTLYDTAMDNKDYRAIDSIIRDMASTPETKKMLAKHDSDIKKLLEYRDQGFTNSKSYFAVKDAEAEYKEQNNLENLSNLDKANIIADTLKSNKEIDFLIGETFGAERNLAYDTARNAGIDPKAAIAWFDTIDGSNTGSTNGKLDKGELKKAYKDADPVIKEIIREIWISKGWYPSQLR